MLTLDSLDHLAPDDVLTPAGAAAEGLSAKDLRRALREGRLVRVTKARYGLPRPDATPEQRHARLGRALLSRYGGAAVLSHYTALADAGLPLYGVDLSRAHLMSRDGGTHRVRSDHVLHRATPAVEALQTGAERLPLAEALIQTGRAGARRFVVPADAALHRGLVTREELAAALARTPHAPGNPLVAATLPRLDAASESPGESLLRLLLRRVGHRVRSQVEVVTPRGVFRLDLAIEGTRVGIEFDGMTKYTDAGVLRAEKRREEALRAAGWVVIRFTWRELNDVPLVRDRVAEALRYDAGRRRGALGARNEHRAPDLTRAG